MSTPHWLSDDEQEFWRLLLAAQRRMERMVEDTLQSCSNLSASEFAVLVCLSESPERQARLRDLCAALAWDRSRTSHQVTRMERRGLVSKCKTATDGRGVVVRLTDAGLRRLEDAAPEHVESVRRIIFDHLNPEDVPALTRFFSGILGVANVPSCGPHPA